MSNEVIEKTKKWKESIERYDETVQDVSKSIIQSYKGDTELDCDKLLKIDEQHAISLICFSETITSLKSIENKKTRKTAAELLTMEPEFAGLDTKALLAIHTNENIESVFYLHEIFIEHSKLIADKIIKLLS